MKIALMVNQKPNNASISHEDFLEWDSMQTISAVSNALEEFHEVVVIDCHPEKLPEVIEKLRSEKPDFCFNMAEGFNGASREAQVPAILDWLAIPYTGSGVATLAITLDKAKTKEVLSYHGLATPSFVVIANIGDLNAKALDKFSYPLIIKPLLEGSSKGINEKSVVDSYDELVKVVEKQLVTYSQPVIVETLLQGREFTVGLIGNGNSIEALPIVEVLFDKLPAKSRRIYSYEAKWVWDDPLKPLEIFQCPAKIPDDVKSELTNVSIQAFKALDCKDWARVDLRLDNEGNVNILEVNALPGVLPDPNENSCFPKAAFMAGISFKRMINRVLDEAFKRYNYYICN